ncbi:MAG: bacillithiol biosynthesis cysteine-adding enzyme BshC [Acidobacteriaceae bacterium]|nr:bacillithiol biosynthesis cysteine-adding enzyme BshC [Acidobacteriaceae bacterium]
MTSNSSSTPSFPATSSTASTTIAVDVRQFSSTRRLASDYTFNFHALAPFFAGDPQDPNAWRDLIHRVQQRDLRRDAIAAIIARQQEQRHAPPAARAAAIRLADPNSVAIVTGQQAGLFGGPLYTLLKALTALKLAEHISAEHDVPALAVFWIDADDHDWDEVRSCTVLDDALSARAISLPPRTTAESVGRIHLDDSVTQAIDELAATLPATEFRDALLNDLRSDWAPGKTVSEAFGCWLERLLGPRGLVVFDASDPAAKPLAADLFVKELTAPGDTSTLASAAGAALVEQGYHAQVQPPAGGVALFHNDSQRVAIRRDGDMLLAGDERSTPAALAAIAAAHPERFSPNVLLRPIVQDTLFPTIAYVAGPNELAYLGQLKAIYARFGVPMPLMYPRATATLLDSAALRFLTKYHVALDTLQPQDDSTLNQLLEAQIPPAVDAAFARTTSAVTTEMTALIAALPAIDPTLEGAARSTLTRMEHDLGTLHNKMIQAAKRRDETLRRQFVRTRAMTFPQGHAQERTISVVSFLNQYGPALVDRLEQALPLESGHHWIVTI